MFLDEITINIPAESDVETIQDRVQWYMNYWNALYNGTIKDPCSFLDLVLNYPDLQKTANEIVIRMETVKWKP